MSTTGEKIREREYQSVRHAIDFMRSATSSGAYLYREIVLSALELIPVRNDSRAVSFQTRPWPEIRGSWVAAPDAAQLQGRSPQSL